MALDFAVLDADGSPHSAVPCNVEVHHAVLAEASARGLPLFQRLGDYYEDTELSPQSLLALVEEIRVLRASNLPPEAQQFLENLCTLVIEAAHKGSAVHVLAD